MVMVGVVVASTQNLHLEKSPAVGSDWGAGTSQTAKSEENADNRDSTDQRHSGPPRSRWREYRFMPSNNAASGSSVSCLSTDGGVTLPTGIVFPGFRFWTRREWRTERVYSLVERWFMRCTGSAHATRVRIMWQAKILGRMKRSSGSGIVGDSICLSCSASRLSLR